MNLLTTLGEHHNSPGHHVVDPLYTSPKSRKLLRLGARPQPPTTVVHPVLAISFHGPPAEATAEPRGLKTTLNQVRPWTLTGDSPLEII